MDRHPDLGPIDHGPRDFFAEAKREQEERERSAAKLKEWNPLGRWAINTITTKMYTRHPISGTKDGARVTTSTYGLSDTWVDNPQLKKFAIESTGDHGIGRTFNSEDEAINFAKKLNKTTLKQHGKELAALYILMVESALDNAYSTLHKVRETVDKYKSFVEHNNTLEGSDG